MITLFRLLFASLVILIISCSRTKDIDEPALGENFFEQGGIYYSNNCATHSNYKKYNGTDTSYYDNGKIKATFTIKDGLPDGHWQKFNDHGTKKVDIYFDHGNFKKKQITK